MALDPSWPAELGRRVLGSQRSKCITYGYKYDFKYHHTNNMRILVVWLEIGKVEVLLPLDTMGLGPFRIGKTWTLIKTLKIPMQRWPPTNIKRAF
jgi:hypothetical protein